MQKKKKKVLNNFGLVQKIWLGLVYLLSFMCKHHSFISIYTECSVLFSGIDIAPKKYSLIRYVPSNSTVVACPYISSIHDGHYLGTSAVTC